MAMTSEYEFTPNLRTKLVADDGREFELPAFAEWLDELKPAAMARLFETSALNRKQCREFWQWLGRTDPVPKRLRIHVNREDLDRLFPPSGQA